MSRIVSFVVLVAIVVLVGALSFRVMSSFLLPMFLALVLVVIFRPLHRWFVDRAKGHDRLAAGLTTAAILLIVLIPTLLILTRASVEAVTLATEFDTGLVRDRLARLRKTFYLELPPSDTQAAIDSMRKSLDALDQSLHHKEHDSQEPKPGDRAEHLARLRSDAAALREQLAIGTPPPPPEDDIFSETGRAHLAATFETLVDRIETLAQHESDEEAFAKELPQVESAWRAFREALLGSPAIEWLRHQANPDPEQLEHLRVRIQEMATPLALGTGQRVGEFLGGLLVGLGVMIISLYYFLADGPTMIRAVMQLSPLDDRYEAELLTEFGTISRAVVLATLLSAFAQGMLASIGYFFAGFDSVFLLTVLTMLLAMIPFVGAAGVWGACCLWLFFEGRGTAAIVLAIYGATVVSMIDNLIKPMVLHGQSKLHPLLALLSILGGIKVLGPIGIFVGPMGVAFLQALLNMLHTEIIALDERPGGGTAGSIVATQASAAAGAAAIVPPAKPPPEQPESGQNPSK